MKFRVAYFIRLKMIQRWNLWCTACLWLVLFAAGESFTRKMGNSSDISHHSRMQKYYHSKVLSTVSQAQLVIDCNALMKPIKEKRDSCLASSKHEVDICVYFAADYNYVIPFLIHHLSLGVSHIWIYNNDEKTAWYKHPAVQCLMEDNYVDIQPWFGENGLHIGLDHCFERRIPQPASRKDKDLTNVWGAVFDIDELLVLHEDTCINKFVEKRPAAPSIAVNWAFFTPEVPLNHFSRTGNPAFMSEAHYEEIKRSSNITHIENEIILPHDMLLRRMFENQHVKSITRHTCAGKWSNEHCAGHKSTCTFGTKPVDPQGHFIECSAFTPWVDNYYPVAQLNHYWTLSLADFLRKIHRGKGGSYSRNFDGSRNTGEFFAHGTVTRQPFVNDTSFHKRYGVFFNELKRDCPRCFDTSLYHV